MLAFAAVWSSSYWVLATNYDAYSVLWGSLLEGDAPMRKYTSLHGYTSRQNTTEPEGSSQWQENLIVCPYPELIKAMCYISF